MELSTATEIANTWHTGRRIDAIKMLRYETSMDLYAAKMYLESEPTELLLHKKLCNDFVQNKSDQLVQAKAEMKRLSLFIEQLEADIQMEHDSLEEK